MLTEIELFLKRNDKAAKREARRRPTGLVHIAPPVVSKTTAPTLRENLRATAAKRPSLWAKAKALFQRRAA